MSKHYYGDARPVNVYENTQKQAGWVEETQTGNNVEFEDTYNDYTEFAAQGKSMQPVNYYRELANNPLYSFSNNKEALLRKCQVDCVSKQTVTTQSINLCPPTWSSIEIVSTTGAIEPSAAVYCTDFIRITPGVNYAIKRFNTGYGDHVVFRSYDADKNYLGAITPSIDNSVYYVRLRVIHYEEPISSLRVMLVQGTAPATYTPFVPNSPSPDYPAPITGRTSVPVYRCGKNLIQFPYLDGASKVFNGITFTVQPDGGIKVFGTATSGSYFRLSNKLNLFFTSVVQVTHTTGKYTNNGNTFSATGLIDGVVFYANIANRVISINVQSGVTVDTVVYPQIELGSTATTYESYNGTDYTLTPQQTLYGLTGAVDSISADGKEVHRTAVKVFDGTEDDGEILMAGDIILVTTNALPGISTTPKPIMCSHYQYGGQEWSNLAEDKTICLEPYEYDTTDAKVYIKDLTYSTIEDFMAWVATQYAAGTPLTIVYPLDTPVTYTNTPQEISLATTGLNTIYSDGSNLAVSYQVKDGQNQTGDILSPTPTYPESIISSGGSVRIEGKNILDRAFISGYYNGTGFSESENYRSLSQDVYLAAGTYTFSRPDGDFYIVRFRVNGEIPLIIGGSSYTFTLTEAAYVNFSWRKGTVAPWDCGETSATAKLQLESGSSMTSYTPYRPIITHALPELRGIPDGSGGWEARDTLEIINGRLIHTKRVGRKVFDGTETISSISGVPYFNGPYDRAFVADNGFFVSHFPTQRARVSGGGDVANLAQETISAMFYSPGNPNRFIYFKSPLYTTAVDFKSYLAAQFTAGTPVTVDYILATPIITDLGPIDLPSYYPFTRVLTEGEYVPDMTVSTKVVSGI